MLDIPSSAIGSVRIGGCTTQLAGFMWEFVLQGSCGNFSYRVHVGISLTGFMWEFLSIGICSLVQMVARSELFIDKADV